MTDVDPRTALTRRGMLVLGGSAAGAAVLAGAGPALARPRQLDRRTHEGSSTLRRQRGSLPVDEIERILDAQGEITPEGLLHIPISRDDLHSRGPQGVLFDGNFEIDGDLYFQPLGGGQAFLNGDLPFKDNEIDPAIDAMLSHGLVFQALHQHFYDLDPIRWFMHFRGVGDATALARGVKAVLNTTSTPFPQTMPSNPTTPLDPGRLAAILHGNATVGSDGVVTVDVDRSDTILIEDVVVNPGANINTNIEFKPLNASGSMTAAAPDFAMTSTEIMAVMRTMRGMGWDIGCLYNQETAEHPQLFFSHQFKVGDPYVLAAEIRQGLNQTAAQ